MAVILLLTFVAAVVEYRSSVASVEQRDRALLERTATALQETMRGALLAGRTATALVGPGGRVDESRLRRFAEVLVEQPDVGSVAWERLVAAENRADLERRLGVRVWEREATGGRVPADGREEYLPVVRAWPAQYEVIRGFDLLSEPQRAAAVRSARDSGRPTLTTPIRLAPAEGTGVLAIAPLYEPGMPTNSVRQRREAFVGTLTVAHYPDVLLDDLLGQLPPGAEVRLTDGRELLAETGPVPADAPEAGTDVSGREWTVAARHPRRASLANVAWILTVGSAVALTVGWAMQRSAKHAQRLSQAHDELAALVGSVQEASLRTPDVPSGVEVAVRYEPAAEHVRLGGDWYDIVTTPQGRLVIAVGDASGHGVEAITHMQRVRQIVAAFAHEGHPPATVFELCDEVLRAEPGIDEQFATVWLGYLDPGTRELRYASAGHPPALVATPGVATVEAVTSPGPPLGLSVHERAWSDHKIELAPKALVCLHTDGLVEGRRGGFDEAAPAIRVLLAEHVGDDLGELAERLMRARPDPGRDDAAVVLLRPHE